MIGWSDYFDFDSQLKTAFMVLEILWYEIEIRFVPVLIERGKSRVRYDNGKLNILIDRFSSEVLITSSFPGSFVIRTKNFIKWINHCSVDERR